MYGQYTDEQIVEMLKPKLAKLGWGNNVTNIDIYPSTCKMIATIYRSAYIRSQLGRSFIIGQPKQTKHWVPATKDNVKVGSKVRFIPKKEKLNPEYFPARGTVGEVVSVIDAATYRVQWFDFTTSCIASQFDLEVLLCE